MPDYIGVLTVATVTGGLLFVLWRRFLARAAAAGLAVAGALIVTGVITWELARSRQYQLFDSMVARVETDRRVVALTLDDGPTEAHTGEVLELLERHGVRASFFLTGSEIAAAPGAARAIAERGHEIGNHTWSHKRLVFHSMDFIRSEIERTDAAIREIGYTGPIHVRSPYGKRLVALPWYLHRTGRLNIFFDVEPESDSAIDGDARRITEHVLDTTRPGSIVLLHVMYPSRRASREALPAIISGLRDRGYEFVTVSELLALRAGD